MKYQFSNVETAFIRSPVSNRFKPNIPYLVTDNFPKLGFLTALRFLEWISENPEGTVSLPTGKTPEYFIKWTKYLLDNWEKRSVEELRNKYGLSIKAKPKLIDLNFVQIDEFYPIAQTQHNSFYHYVNKFYIRELGFNPSKALLINIDRIPRADNLPIEDIFPTKRVDLSLRYRECKSDLEEKQQQTIFMVDKWCSDYENIIRERGGIDFFLGGIGPDGHIAFNVRGSDHNSTTRLTETNFETQAASATDLGGIETSKNRLVITIGLSTITYNKDVTGIIIAAGEAKARVVKNAVESKKDIRFPATALQGLPNCRFYLTSGAAKNLSSEKRSVLQDNKKITEKTEKAVLRLCRSLNKFGSRISLEDLNSDKDCSVLPSIDSKMVSQVMDSVKRKIYKGLTIPENEIFLHTGPHHDDIMLGYLPHIIHLVRTPLNKHYFVNMTSGFTSVTNKYIIDILQQTNKFLTSGQIQMTKYSDFFTGGYNKKRDKDVYHYLNQIATGRALGQKRGLSHRVVRSLVEIYSIKNITELEQKINSLTNYLYTSYDGEKNTPDIQRLKGMVREFEEELVWAHYGVSVKDVYHLRLGFYTGDIFTEIPDRYRDVEPILELLIRKKPTVITLAFDPEGSGPDTHYKVMQTIAEAVRIWKEKEDLSNLRIWGYRNVWYRFDAAEADIIVPVSLNSMSVLENTFLNCYLSQKSASFPSYQLDGPFCDLTNKIWVEQHQDLEFLLGKDFWYQNNHPRLRATHGVLYLKEMNVVDFLTKARQLEKSMETPINI